MRVDDVTDWGMVSMMLAIRSDGRCEGCGEPFQPGVIDPSRHHRKPRRMGGRRGDAHNSLSNLLLLCGGSMGGVHGCHGDVERFRTKAYVRGFLVNEYEDPADVVVVLWSSRRVLLDSLSPFYLPAPGPVYQLDP